MDRSERQREVREGKRVKIFFFRREWLTVAGCLALAAAMFWVASYPDSVGAAATSRQIPVYCVEREEKVISLTFDAAWGNEDTETLIEILGDHGVTATFFVVGDWVDKYPESVRALSDAGHEIMNHSNQHDYLTSLSADEIIADLNVCNDKIEAITGVRPSLVRCPYGDYNDTVVNAIHSMGMEAIQWDVDSLDWKEISADEIFQRVTSKVSPGSIVLFHNAALHTPEALGAIIETLLEDGYSFVPVSRLLLEGECSIDSSGRQCEA